MDPDADPRSGRDAALRDPGLQAERTALAWQRTAVATLVLTLLALGAAAHRLSAGGDSSGHPSPAVETATVAAVLVAAVAAVAAGVQAVLVVPRQVNGLVRLPTSGRLLSPYVRLHLVALAAGLLGVAGGLLAVAGALSSVAS